ncbi:hypothetical protein B0H17DRAFT_1248593 [Mycena rosella]|uniref:Uncharacterized protein n=1 Tax=Mycena rosella TaxID=1033263 RepID=A0AAD7CXM8_MYCRO|nr:hypothetical protein B0H17DRAFT_1248593 [Mycena rosella]
MARARVKRAPSAGNLRLRRAGYRALISLRKRSVKKQPPDRPDASRRFVGKHVLIGKSTHNHIESARGDDLWTSNLNHYLVSGIVGGDETETVRNGYDALGNPGDRSKGRAQQSVEEMLYVRRILRRRGGQDVGRRDSLGGLVYIQITFVKDTLDTDRERTDSVKELELEYSETVGVGAEVAAREILREERGLFRRFFIVGGGGELALEDEALPEFGGAAEAPAPAAGTEVFAKATARLAASARAGCRARGGRCLSA